MAESQEHIEAQLCAYIDGELDAKGRAEIEKHLANNPQHQKLIAGLIETRAMMRALPREKAPDDIVESVQHSLERSVLLADVEEESMAMPRRMRGQYPMLVAAMVLLVIGLGVVIFYMLPTSSRPGEVAVVTPAKEDSKKVATTREVAPSAVTAPEVEVALKAGPSEAKVVERDVFRARGGAERRDSKAPQIADALSNSNSLNDLAKNADDHLVLVVDTDNPAVTNGQVTSYLASNGIAWQEVSEPMPQPLEIAQNQVVEMSRLNQTHVQLRAANNQVQLSAGAGALKMEQSGQLAISGGGAGGTTQPSQTFAIAPSTTPASVNSPSELVYQYLGFGPSNLDSSKFSNRFVANMTRRQAEELSATLRSSRSGQRAMVYGRVLYDAVPNGGLVSNAATDKAGLNFSLRQELPAFAGGANTAIASTTQPSSEYYSKAGSVTSASAADEVASTSAVGSRKIYPGGAKIAAKASPPQDLSQEAPGAPAAPTTVSGSEPLQKQKELKVADGRLQEKDLDESSTTQQVFAQQLSATTQPSEEMVNVFICVNNDAAATQPAFSPTATSQPSLNVP